MAAEKVATGLRALKMAEQLAPMLGPLVGHSSIGIPVNVPAGTIDTQSRTIYLGQGGGYAYYLRENALWQAPLGQVIQGLALGEVASEVYRRTAWILPAAQATMAFSMALAGGVFGAAAVVASITVLAIRIAIFYDRHQAAVNLAVANLRNVVNILKWFSDNCPKTAEKLREVLRNAAISGLLSAPRGITAADVAAILGSMLGGAAAAGDPGVRMLLKVLKGMVTTTATRLPAMAGRGLAANVRTAADALIDQLQSNGVHVRADEAAAIRQEFARQAAAEGKLAELRAALEQVGPMIERLSREFRLEAPPGP